MGRLPIGSRPVGAGICRVLRRSTLARRRLNRSSNLTQPIDLGPESEPGERGVEPGELVLVEGGVARVALRHQRRHRVQIELRSDCA